MEKPCIVVVLTLALSGIVSLSVAQDVIVMRNGDELKAKVTEVGQNEIKYHKFDNLTGPVYSLKKADVFMIRYENGSKDVFKETVPPKIESGSRPDEPNKAEKANNKPSGLSRRSGGAAFLYSFLYPGAGQLYARKKVKGIIMAGTFTAATVVFFVAGNETDYTTDAYWNGSYYEYNYNYYSFWSPAKTAGLVAMAAIKVWSMIDAPISAKSTNKKLGLASIKLSPDSYWFKGVDGKRHPAIGAKLEIRF